MNYLPNAFGFIYVIDVSSAGGINKNIKEKFKQMLGIIQSVGGRTDNENRLADCSLFVCNKWDQIKENERPKVQSHVAKQLGEVWKNAHLNEQIVYISTENAKTAQKYGGVTTEYQELLQKLKLAILRAIKKRLYDHWQWLDEMLYHIHKSAYEYRTKVQLNDMDIRKRIMLIEKRTAEIEKKEKKARNDISEQLEQKTNYLATIMYGYISSMEFRTKFCVWKDVNFPPIGDTWAVTKSNVKKAVENKFEELLIQWESENQIYAEIHSYLTTEFLTRMNLIKDELDGIEKAMHGQQKHEYFDSIKPPQMSRQTKVVIGMTVPIWLPVGVASLVVGMPVIGAYALKKQVDKKSKRERYSQDPRSYLKKKCTDFLESLTEDTVLKYAGKQMEKTFNILWKYASYIPILIEENRKLVSNLRNETRTQGEIERLYEPIEKNSRKVQEQITPLGIRLYPAKVDVRDLEWQNDMEFCLREDEFSRVYSGKLKTNEREGKKDKNVAVKVFTHPFDFMNQRLLLQEEHKIR